MGKFGWSGGRRKNNYSQKPASQPQSNTNTDKEKEDTRTVSQRILSLELAKKMSYHLKEII